MASTNLSAKSSGYCYVILTFNNRRYEKVKLFIMEQLATDIILGTDFQEQHESITIKYGGKKPLQTIVALTTMETLPPELFAHVTPDCKPIASKSKKYSNNDWEFMNQVIPHGGPKFW